MGRGRMRRGPCRLRCAGATGSTAPELTVAKVLRNKGYFLELLQRSDGAVAAYDEVVRRFGDDRSAELRCEVAMALVNKGYSLGELDRGDEALGAYEEVVCRFGGMDSLRFDEVVSGAKLVRVQTPHSSALPYRAPNRLLESAPQASERFRDMFPARAPIQVGCPIRQGQPSGSRRECWRDDERGRPSWKPRRPSVR